MKDPYEVLEVGRNASQEEIKAAYRRLVKQYHPDKYRNNPLADLAQEKLKEVNEAYDSLSGGSGRGQGAQGYNQTEYSGGAEFDQIRQYINMGNLQAAEMGLNKSQLRNAEWFFLKGMISQRKGWHDDALSNIQQAVAMDPNNYEYKRALNGMAQQGGAFRNTAYGRGYNTNEDMMCKMCQCYMCTDLLCDCI